MTTPFLSGERVSLRPVERDDAAFLQRSSTDPRIRVPLGANEPWNAHQTESFIEEVVEKGDGVSFVVEADGEPIGLVAVKSLEPVRPELVYWFLPEHHGQGYGTEAVGLLVDHVFETYDCHGVSAGAFETNPGSQALLRKLGFSEEGRLREDRFSGGEYVDLVNFGLLRREWAGR